MTDALTPALHRFQDAVSALINPQCHYLDGRRHYTDSPYQQLVDSLAGQQGYTADFNPRSMPLLWVDAHDTLVRIDTTVAQWPLERATTDQPPKTIPPTVTRLQALAQRTWRPQDTQLLTDRAAQLEALTKTVRNLLLPEITIYLRGHKCPICGHTHIQRTDSGGQNVSAPALMIKGDAALCQQCQAVWDYTRLPMLGRMLGLQPTAIIGEGS